MLTASSCGRTSSKQNISSTLQEIAKMKDKIILPISCNVLLVFRRKVHTLMRSAYTRQHFSLTSAAIDTAVTPQCAQLLLEVDVRMELEASQLLFTAVLEPVLWSLLSHIVRWCPHLCTCRAEGLWCCDSAIIWQNTEMEDRSIKSKLSKQCRLSGADALLLAIFSDMIF